MSEMNANCFPPVGGAGMDNSMFLILILLLFSGGSGFGNVLGGSQGPGCGGFGGDNNMMFLLLILLMFN